MSEVLERAKALRDTAKSRTISADRRKGKGAADYSEPIELLKEAINLLSRELEKVKGKSEDEEPGLSNKLASLLVDCYGMLGGVYRRAGDLDQSIETYDAGQEYEWDSAYDVQNSYNITNAIAVRVLKDPRSLAALREQIGRAIALIWKQVNGKRRNQWWAWADLGELRLLAGSADEAHKAYLKFRECGPRAGDYVSTISVLDDLREAVSQVDAEAAAAITDTVTFLNENKPKV